MSAQPRRLAPPQPPLTTQRRLGPGAVLRTGLSASYRAVAITDGEPHLVRDDFGLGDAGRGGGAGRPLLCLAHLTDLQLADVQSPTRFEFLNRHYADPRYAEILPVQRPQEALTPHAVDAMLRTVNAAFGPATGAPLDLAVTTGDGIDNAQWNELQTFLALFNGGLVTPDSGGPKHEGAQSLDWPDDFIWRPDGGHDFFRREFGFGHHPGLLERAMARFGASGLNLPWLSCFGNHEALNAGVGVITPAVAEALVGPVKPFALPDGFDHGRAMELFTTRPEAFLTGPARTVTADPGRRPISRREFVEAHFLAGARPAGHGFGARNLRDGTAYYVHDTPAVRLIALDTTCLAGGADGCLDWQQARWLEAALAEVHSAYRGSDGQQVRTGHEDRLVIVFSHHGTGTLSNTRHLGPGGEPLVSANDLLSILYRYPNVVLWLNGHTHTNAVRARQDPRSSERGFWEVTTCAIVDWPCQARLVELIDGGDHLSIVATMLDHDSPVSAASLDTGGDLAALHRELAGNVPFGGFGSHLAGEPADRNVELHLRAPFPLRHLPGRGSA